MSSATKRSKAFQGTENFSRPTMTALPRDVQHNLVMGPAHARMKFFEGQERMRLQKLAEEQAAALAAQQAQLQAQQQADAQALAQLQAAQMQGQSFTGFGAMSQHQQQQQHPQPSLMGPAGFHVPSTGFSRRKRSLDDE